MVGVLGGPPGFPPLAPSGSPLQLNFLELATFLKAEFPKTKVPKAEYPKGTLPKSKLRNATCHEAT